jgi:hypothetical protein
MRLREIDINGAPVVATAPQKASETVKQKDWLRLLLRESLGAGSSTCLPSTLMIHRTVNLKYVLSTQVVQIQYESRTHFFSVAAVKPKTRNAIHPQQNISESFEALSVHDPTLIYMVDWDTSITIEDNIQASGPKPRTVSKFSSLHVFGSI